MLLVVVRCAMSGERRRGAFGLIIKAPPRSERKSSDKATTTCRANAMLTFDGQPASLPPRLGQPRDRAILRVLWRQSLLHTEYAPVRSLPFEADGRIGAQALGQTIHIYVSPVGLPDTALGHPGCERVITPLLLTGLFPHSLFTLGLVTETAQLNRAQLTEVLHTRSS